MKNDITDILFKYTTGEATLEETNEALKEAEAGFHLEPGKNEITPEEAAQTVTGETPEEVTVYGDNVIEKHGINRDRTGDREKTRYLCGKQGIFTRDRALIRPGSIRQLETRASTRSASFFRALGGPTTAAALLGHIVPTTGRNP